MRRWRADARWVVALIPVLLTACGGPAALPPTVATLTVTEAADANATASGRGAPIRVRVYQLGATSGFEKAEFFQLLNADSTTLGQDLVKRDEYLLVPGTKREETITATDKVQAIGVFAAYREFGSRPWRIVVPLPANKTTPVKVSVGASGLVAAP